MKPSGPSWKVSCIRLSNWTVLEMKPHQQLQQCNMLSCNGRDQALHYLMNVKNSSNSI